LIRCFFRSFLGRPRKEPKKPPRVLGAGSAPESRAFGIAPQAPSPLDSPHPFWGKTCLLNLLRGSAVRGVCLLSSTSLWACRMEIGRGDHWSPVLSETTVLSQDHRRAEFFLPKAELSAVQKFLRSRNFFQKVPCGVWGGTPSPLLSLLLP